MYNNHADNGIAKINASAAKKQLTSRQNTTELPQTPVGNGLKHIFIPTVPEALRPICPNPDEGFQPLSPYQIKRITKQVMCHMEALCKERKILLDLTYWERQTRFILGSESTKDTLVISSPAGSGKSTWCEAFTRTFIELSQTDTELADSLVGIALVFQKVEDLNRLAEVLNSDSPQNTPNMVALQGWSQSGKKLGFCQNSGVNSFEECCPNSCPYVHDCKLRIFRQQAFLAPIVGLTQERFAMLRESGSLNSVLYRTDEIGRFRPRRYLIFDEKFPMAQINTLDKDCIDCASMEFSELIGKKSAADSQVRSLQQSLAYHIEQPFQALRRSLCIQTESGNRDIQAGFCVLSPEYAKEDRRHAFQHFSDFVLCQRKQYATRHLRTALAVMAALYNGEPCLFSKTNGFAITDIVPPPLQYGESQSIIFDATAQVDRDYLCLENTKFSKGFPQRSQCHLTVHIYTHRDLNVSKQAMNKPWKIPALSQFAASLVKDTRQDVFLCSYKNCSDAFADILRKTLHAKDYQHILLMPDREHDTIPYFGGTNGSNLFNSATTVFMLGYPRLNPRDYLIHACSAYGKMQLGEELSGIPPEQLTSKDLNILYSIPSVQAYVAHHLAARLEQEIYRCALRNPDFTGKIDVYLFCPPTDMLNILLPRLQAADIIYHEELPPCVEVERRSARRYESGQTSYGRLVQFLASWNGTEISVRQLRDDLGISAAVWKDLMCDDRVKDFLNQCQIQRKGRGQNAVLYKTGQALCA